MRAEGMAARFCFRNDPAARAHSAPTQEAWRVDQVQAQNQIQASDLRDGAVHAVQGTRVIAFVVASCQFPLTFGLFSSEIWARSEKCSQAPQSRVIVGGF